MVTHHACLNCPMELKRSSLDRERVTQRLSLVRARSPGTSPVFMTLTSLSGVLKQGKCNSVQLMAHIMYEIEITVKQTVVTPGQS
jgi:hypothetical protein